MNPQSLEVLKSACEKAAFLTESWMLGHLQMENIYLSDHKDPVSYYKWPLTLYARGKKEEASNLLNWICEKSLKVDGDFQSDRSGFHHEFHNYANLWLVLGAIQIGEENLTEQLLGFIFKSYNPRTGGVATNPYIVDFPSEDPLSASFLGMALCALKNKNVADKIMQYLTGLVDKQDAEDTFWLRTNSDGALIRELRPNVDPKVYKLELGKEEESYYFLGSICLFLTSYLENFNDQSVLSLAYRIAEILERIGEKAIGTIWAAKVAPGCTGLYANTQDPLFLDLARPVIYAVLDGQTDEGYWLKDEKPWITVSAEQCYWLTYMSQRL